MTLMTRLKNMLFVMVMMMKMLLLMKMLIKMLLVMVMMIAGEDSVGWQRRRVVAAWSDYREALTLRLRLRSTWGW